SGHLRRVDIRATYRGSRKPSTAAPAKDLTRNQSFWLSRNLDRLPFNRRLTERQSSLRTKRLPTRLRLDPMSRLQSFRAPILLAVLSRKLANPARSCVPVLVPA